MLIFLFETEQRSLAQECFFLSSNINTLHLSHPASSGAHSIDPGSQGGCTPLL